MDNLRITKRPIFAIVDNDSYFWIMKIETNLEKYRVVPGTNGRYGVDIHTNVINIVRKTLVKRYNGGRSYKLTMENGERKSIVDDKVRDMAWHVEISGVEDHLKEIEIRLGKIKELQEEIIHHIEAQRLR